MLLFSKYKLPMITHSSFALFIRNSIQGCLQMVGRISWHDPQYNRLAQDMAWSYVVLWYVSQALCCTASEVRSVGMCPWRCFGRSYRTVSHYVRRRRDPENVLVQCCNLPTRSSITKAEKGASNRSRLKSLRNVWETVYVTDVSSGHVINSKDTVKERLAYL